MKFHKYQALGNAYLVLECDQPGVPSTAFVRGLCDRHYGIGADGILVAGPHNKTGFSLRIFNPDGSEAEKSDNGLRICARYLWDMRRVAEEPFEVATKGGVVRCQVQGSGSQIAVAMGAASFDSSRIPVTGPPREVINEAIEVTVSDDFAIRMTGPVSKVAEGGIASDFLRTVAGALLPGLESGS